MATQHAQVATKYLVSCMRKIRQQPSGQAPPASILCNPRFQHKYKRSAAPRVTFVDTAQDTVFLISDTGLPA
eukprot:7655681-Ditylum_brightwellii.AAC.1